MHTYKEHLKVQYRRSVALGGFRLAHHLQSTRPTLYFGNEPAAADPDALAAAKGERA